MLAFLTPLRLNQHRLFIDLIPVGFFNQRGLNASIGVQKYGTHDAIFHKHKNWDMNNEFTYLNSHSVSYELSAS